MASVTVYFSGHEQGIYQLDKPMMVVGREASSQIYLDNRSISRQHCAFVFKGNDFLIQDLNSANGTYVNGQRVTEQRLSHGDEIVIGSYELRYLSASSIPVPPAAPVVSSGVDETANTLDENAFRNVGAAVAAPAAKAAPPRSEVKESSEWFYADKDRQAGPVDIGTLKRLIKANVVTRNTLIWKEGMPNWSAASEVPGMMLAEPPPLPPSPRQPPPLPMAAPHVGLAAAVRPAAPVHPSPLMATMPLGGASPFANVSGDVRPQLAPLDKPLFASLGRYLLIWGIALMITGCWEAWSVVRLGPAVGNSLIFAIYVAVVLASMVCAILSIFAGASFAGLSKAQSSDMPGLMHALSSMQKVCFAQCVLALLLLAILILPRFL